MNVMHMLLENVVVVGLFFFLFLSFLLLFFSLEIEVHRKTNYNRLTKNRAKYQSCYSVIHHVMPGSYLPDCVCLNPCSN